MADPRVTVQRLIALALNPSANENEARNAALSACRLIQEHQLLDPPRKARPQALEDLFSDFFGDAEVIFSRPRARRPAEEPVPPPPQPSVPGSTPRRPPDHNAKLIPITMPTWCTGCGQPLRRGSYGTWSRGEVWHSGCYKAATGASHDPK